MIREEAEDALDSAGRVMYFLVFHVMIHLCCLVVTRTASLYYRLLSACNRKSGSTISYYFIVIL